jgi:hypothetical protein
VATILATAVAVYRAPASETCPCAPSSAATSHSDRRRPFVGLAPASLFAIATRGGQRLLQCAKAARSTYNSHAHFGAELPHIGLSLLSWLLAMNEWSLMK